MDLSVFLHETYMMEDSAATMPEATDSGLNIRLKGFEADSVKRHIGKNLI